jgi:hypothetical protein
MLATIQSISVSPVPPSVPDDIIRAHGAPVNVARAVPGVVEDVCSVCQDPITMRQSTTRTPCDHWFHHNCIARWISSSVRDTPTCPLCRQSLSDQFIEVLDNFGNHLANREVLDGDDL